MNRALIPLLLLSASTTVGCGKDEPQPTVFNLTLSPANETPPCPTAGTSATGTATVTVPPDNASVIVTVSYTGLSGPVTGGHIHSGTSAAPGPVVLPFSTPLDSPFTRTLGATDYLAATGAPADFATFVTALKAGGAGYVNLHTGACKPGEIRAEIQ